MMWLYAPTYTETAHSVRRRGARPGCIHQTAECRLARVHPERAAGEPHGGVLVHTASMMTRLVKSADIPPGVILILAMISPTSTTLIQAVILMLMETHDRPEPPFSCPAVPYGE